MAVSVTILLLFFCQLVSSQTLDRSTLFIGYSERIATASGTSGHVNLTTPKGKIQVSLMRKNAPHTISAVMRAAEKQAECPNCRFYRNEDRPQRGSLGPPYGLLQGSLASLEANSPREGNIVARRGHVCSIPGTKEFFIATSDHSEWGTAHTCWGEVDDLSAVESIVAAPYTNFTHPDYGTIMRMLVSEIPFQLQYSAA